MSGLARPTPDKAIGELTRRLAEDYPAVPLPEVSRIVRAATVAALGADGKWAGTAEGIHTVVDVIDSVAREDLDSGPSLPAPREEIADAPGAKRARGGAGRAEARPNARRRGAASRG